MGDKNKKKSIDELLANNTSCDDINMTYGKKPRKKICVKQTKCEELMIVAEGKEKEIIDVITTNDEKKIKSTVTKLEGNLLKYLDKNIRFVVDNDGKIWFHGGDVGKILQYGDPNAVISNNINNENKITYEDFLLKNQVPNFLGTQKLKGRVQKNSMFITKEALIKLCLKSSAKCADNFQNYVTKLLNKIDDGEDIYEEDVNTTETTFIKHINAYEAYVKHNSALEIKNENTLYLAEIGVVSNVGCDTTVKKGERIFKLGITDRGNERDVEHKKNVDEFVTFYYKKCIYNKKLEDDLKYELRSKGLMRNCRFNNGVKYTELFTTNEDFAIDDVKKFIDEWVNKKDYVDSANLDLQLKIEKEKTKQAHLITEQKRYEYEILKLQMKKK